MVRKKIGLFALFVLSLQVVWAELPRSFALQNEIEILTSNSFICKAKDNSILGNARLRVQINNLEIVADPNTAARIKDFLNQLFTTAKRIELENVVYKTGFRLSADIKIDGQQLSKLLLDTPIALPKAKQAPQADPNTVLFVPNGLLSATTNNNEDAQQPRKIISLSASEVMARQIDLQAITPDTPLGEALDILCQSIEPRLPLLVLWGDLESNTLVQRDSPCGIGGLSKIRLRQALELLLRSAAGSGPKPVILIEGGIITIASPQTIKKINTVYSIEDVLQAPSSDTLYTNQNGTNQKNR